jgi:hypothetical protein
MGDFVGVSGQNLRALANKLNDLAGVLAKEGPLIKSLMEAYSSQLDYAVFARNCTQNGEDSLTLGKRADRALTMDNEPHFGTPAGQAFQIPGWGIVHPPGTNGPFLGEWASGSYTLMPFDDSDQAQENEGMQDATALVGALKNPADPHSKQIFTEVALSVADHQNDHAYMQAYLNASGCSFPVPYSPAAANAALLHAAEAANNTDLFNQAKAALQSNLNDSAYVTAFAQATPISVTSFQGLPAVAANTLNRAQLGGLVDLKTASPAEQALWDDLTSKDNSLNRSDMYLLGFDGIGDGHAAVSYGNPDTAPNTAVYVPGTGSSLTGAGHDLGRSIGMYKLAEEQAPGQSASVYWLGYNAPQWNVPGPASQSFADAGGQQLAAFVNSLNADHVGADHVTVIGHSYGSTVVGDAFAHFGMKAGDAVFVGSPGTTVQTAGQLNVDPSHVWAGKAKFDPIPEISADVNPDHWFDDHSLRFGNDPTSTAFGGQTFDSGDGSSVATAHSGYWDDGSPSLANMTDIVLGKYQDVTQMPTDQQIGVLPSPNPIVTAGSLLQNGGHLLGDWGAPIEHAGDGIHAFGTATSNVSGAFGDFATGDYSGGLQTAEDIPGDLWSSTKSFGSAVGDLFDW